jgi:hypothetical protein
MLRILPGIKIEPVQITIYHQRFSDMPSCSALSYEWGNSTDRHTIFCDGDQLQVKTNLLILLKQLRSSTETGNLWIDAICS